MKKVLAVVAAVGCIAAATVSFAGIGAGTGVNGSLHDMTRVVPETADAMGRVCVYCHAPHHAIVDSNGDADGGKLPLWNHQITDVQFSPYVWATPLNLKTGDEGAEVPIVDPLIGPSRLCMSCHDGVTAIDQHSDGGSFGQYNTTGGTILRTYVSQTHDGGQRSNLGGASGTDLSQTHPIGFNYNTIAAFRNARADNSGGSTVGTEIVESHNGYATNIVVVDAQGGYNTVTRDTKRKIEDHLYGSEIMTCATCHDVHNKENALQENYNTPIWEAGEGGTDAGDTSVLGVDQAAPNYFLYAKQFKSLICLSCHIK